MESGRLETVFVGNVCHGEWNTFLRNETVLSVGDDATNARFSYIDAIVTFELVLIRSIGIQFLRLTLDFCGTLWLCVGIRLAQCNGSNARQNNQLFREVVKSGKNRINRYIPSDFSFLHNSKNETDLFEHDIYFSILILLKLKEH